MDKFITKTTSIYHKYQHTKPSSTNQSALSTTFFIWIGYKIFIESIITKKLKTTNGLKPYFTVIKAKKSKI